MDLRVLADDQQDIKRQDDSFVERQREKETDTAGRISCEMYPLCE